MAFKFNRNTKYFFNNNKFKQNKKVQESSILNPISDSVITKLVSEKKVGRFDKKAVLKKLAENIKFRVIKPKVKKSTKVVVRTRQAIRRQKVKIFFKKLTYSGPKKGRILSKAVINKSYYARKINKAFNLPLAMQRTALIKYKKGAPLTRLQGVYIWALLNSLKRGTLWNKYQTQHPKMEKINKQLQWEERQKTFLFKLLDAKVKTGNYGFNRLIKSGLRLRFFKHGLKKNKAFWAKKRQQFAIWRLVINKRSRHWKFKRLNYKLRVKVAHSLQLRPKRSFGRKVKKKVFKNFRVYNARTSQRPSLFTIRDFAIRDQVRIQRLKAKLARLQDLVKQAYLSKIKKKSKPLNIEVFNKRIKILGDELKYRYTPKPLPLWKKKQLVKQDIVTKKALAIFNQAFPEYTKTRNKWKTRHKLPTGYNHRLGKVVKNRRQLTAAIKRKLRWVRWFKLQTVRYNLFKQLFQWKGMSKSTLLGQGFKRFNLIKKFYKGVQKQAFIFNTKSSGFTKLQLQRSLQKVTLKNVVNYPDIYINVLKTVPTDVLSQKPMFFSLYKATHALDFNKFFKVNKITARSISEISNDFYTQYLTNLSQMEKTTAMIATKTANKNVHTARVLRKYIKLLRIYFNEVYNNKLAKKIPASSAMHWVREYLRLTSGIKRRVSLWNRFNRVAFHFRPKAKEDEKRGRKKKILFKAKILFDRLFKWLYEQPNARYALAAPIQNGIVRDYIVRNQFIFKKQFKVKLGSKVK